VTLVALSVAALLSVAPASSSTARIPFTWTPGQIEIAVRVNDTHATFLLDTASEYSVVSSRLAAQLHLALEHTHGRDFADDVWLAIGGITLEHQRVMVMPFEGYYAQGRSIDGLIGYDLFARFVVAIDFTERRLTVSEPSSFKRSADTIAVPIDFVGRLATVQSKVGLTDGRSLGAHLVVDTGAPQGVILRYPFAEANGLLNSGSVASGPVAPALRRKLQTLIDVPVQEVSIGDWTFDHPRVEAQHAPSGSGAFTSTDGLIGNTLLQRFVLFVDYPHRRLLLKPLRHKGGL
jgi:Aspartyl protease